MSINHPTRNLTPYQYEILHNIRRNAEHGRDHAIDVLLSNYVDVFNHILNELELIGIVPPILKGYKEEGYEQKE